jgi:hypothetical protein
MRALLDAWEREREREWERQNCYPLTEQTTGHRSCDEIDLINVQGGSERAKNAETLNGTSKLDVPSRDALA